MSTNDGPRLGQPTDETNDETGSQLALPLFRGIRKMRAVEASEMIEGNAVSAIPESSAALELYDRVDVSVGARLRAARESRCWSLADVAGRLKLPLKLIERVECDDYEGLTGGVFLRGYLASYARLVGMPVEETTSIAAAHTHTAPLVATGTISRSRYLFDRYSVSATYLVLTAIIVVPAVWLATHGGLEQDLARTTPLDPPVSIISAPVRDAVSIGAEVQPAPSGGLADAKNFPNTDAGSAQPAAPLTQDPAPVIASMAPFASAPTQSAATTPAEAAPSAEGSLGSGAHTLKLKLREQSWVEITTAEGHKLEYRMLAADSEHTYRSDSQLSVRVGNVQGAQLQADGAVLDLTPFQRGNVAHLKVFGATGSGVSRLDQ